MNAHNNTQILYKPAAADWNQRQKLTAQASNSLFLNRGDTLTVSRSPDTPGQSFLFYFPASYRIASWQRAREIFEARPELDGVTLKKQPEGCYRLRFWHQAEVDVDPAPVLQSIRSLAPVNAPVSASNNCPFYVVQHHGL